MIVPSSPYLSIIIPAYNEEKRLPATLHKIYSYLKKQNYHWEIIVVDDGSSDQTVKQVQNLRKSIPRLKLIANKENRGKGAVVKQGMLAAKGEWRLFADADNSTPINQLEKLFKYQKNYQIIIGSRHLDKGSIKSPPPWYRSLISTVSNRLIQLLVTPGIHDTQCGFKLFYCRAAEKIFPQQTVSGWLFDIEILGLAKKFRLPIKEVAVDWYNSPASRVRALQALILSMIELIKIWWRIKIL